MVSTSLVILNPTGLHLRPAKSFCMEALEYPCRINIYKGASCYNAKSVLGILSAGVKYGDVITVECDGENEEQALRSLESMVQGGFGEEIIPLQKELV